MAGGKHLEDRPLVASGTGAIAVTPHHLATAAAIRTLADGGNAADAAIAANAVQGVVAPETCGIGGDLFALVWHPGSHRPLALNASGRAGSGVTAEQLRAAGHTAVPLHGTDSITVPGCIDGWEALAARCGRLPLAAALAPAIEAAVAGFPASPELTAALAAARADLAPVASAAALYPGGRPPEPGEPLTRPDLGITLAAVAADGRAAFYAGAAGAGITAATQGAITADDLGRTQADWVEPLGAAAYGRTGWTIPPNSQGWLTLAAAWLLERLAPPADPGDPAWAHAQIEAYRAVAWERDDLVADPEHLTVPPADLVDPDRLAPRLAALRPEAAATWAPPRPAPGGTAYLCVVDGDGMAVSLIQSNFHGIGSRRGAGATGVLLHNRGAGFCLEPGHPNELGPGKRPLHTLSPTVWARDGALELVLGTRGGHQQPQYLLQFVAAVLGLGDGPGAAQQRPRWSTASFAAGAPSRVEIEDRAPAAVVAGLRARGHRVDLAGPWMGGWGPVSAIAVAGNGSRTGAADPRVSTAAAQAS